MRIRYLGIGIAALFTIKGYSQSKSTTNYQMMPVQMQSRWAKEVNAENTLKEYPRPQFERKKWKNLNGLWDYSITDSTTISPDSFDGSILVPFPIESALSGVQKKLMPDKRLWYRKVIQKPTSSSSERIFLNFGAVDWKATIFINKKLVGQHTGGYLHFSFDITDYLNSGDNEILVKVYDPSDQGPNPHGKQVLNPANIYYTASSGIWQTVWLEIVSEAHISCLKSTPDIDKGVLQLCITTEGIKSNSSLEISISENSKTLSTRKLRITQKEENSTIKIPNARLWSPNDPYLYDLTVRLIRNGKVTDEIKSYFGMRKISIQKDEKGADRIFLNNKYTYNLGTLDQGFWPEGLYTAPTDDALAFDIKAVKSLGFNTIRKHIKVEPERWYYHADKIGVLVWQDFVNPPHGLPEGSKSIFEKETQETIDQLYNHPSIVTWVLFNERWGVYDQERLTKWVKGYDSSRIVNGHSGELLYVNDQLREPSINPWIGSDMTDVHSYPDPKNAVSQANKAKVIGEFGGIGVPVFGHEWDDMKGWGYIQATPNELKKQYSHMIDELVKLEATGLSASIYTQPFDVEGEENGLLTYDREKIKIPINELRNINQRLFNQTQNFSLDPNFVIATNIDTNITDQQYPELLTKYENGARDSALLRRTILISLRNNDQVNTTNIGNAYVSILKNPFSTENLTFIRNVTRTTKDTGFSLFMKNPEVVDAVLGDNFASRTIKSIIDAQEIAPYIKTTPNWKLIQETMTNKYGNIGEELVLGKQLVYYGFEAKQKDWKLFAKYYTLYYEKALSHTDYNNNNMSWLIYENVNDPKVLEFAVGIMKYTIEKLDRTAEAYDTYAQLLHKINKTSEAIPWEEKALELGKGTRYEKLFAETLQKMKAGLPTWPQTQNN